jgi:predicted negative regulator of RcsB-dependent stress response
VDDLLSEKEQIEQMRTWWSEYGNYVIGGVVLGAAVLFGINYVQTSQLEAQYAASGLYDDLTNFVVDGNVDEAELVVGTLAAEYPESNYAAQSKLAMARLYMDKNRDQDAADVLSELVAGNVSDEFKQVGRVRLAKIFLYQDKAAEVVAMLEGQEGGAFAARNADVLGDAYAALDRVADARDAYQRALAESGGGATVDQQFVQLKLLDLPIENFAVAEDVTVDEDIVTDEEEE